MEECNDDDLPCTCREAVTRAYRSLRASGMSETVAFEAAIRIFRFHHPEAAPGEAAGLVEDWVAYGTVH